jgi:hypothetical protein
MRGVRFMAGSDLQLPAGSIKITLDENGVPQMAPVTPHFRTDMWPYWLLESVEAGKLAIASAGHLAEAGNADPLDDAALDLALSAELRSTMRAITAAAFAVDAFYSSVKARAGEHPSAKVWREKRTARHTQVFETIRYHLKGKDPGAAEMRSRIVQLFRLRDWAVHPGSRFREAVLRPDIDVGVDWHFSTFRAENAATAVAMTTSMLDVMVALLLRGNDELQNNHPGSRRAMNLVLDAYEATDLPVFERAEDRIDQAPAS